MQSGKETLADGQMDGSIRIQLVDNDTWTVEATQSVHMKNPSSNAVLGELKTASVVVLNDDSFPSQVQDQSDKLLMVSE